MRHLLSRIAKSKYALPCFSVISVATSVLMVLLLDLALKGRVEPTDLLIGMIVPLVITPMIGDVILSLVRELEAAQEALKALANRDALTGLANRRHFLEIAEHEWALARRHGRVLGLMLFDVDRFKAVNDSFGHPVGDLALQHIATVCLATLRESDLLARYGGEEFAVLLVQADHDAGAAAERMRAALESRPLVHAGTTVPLTVSMGVAWNLPPHDTLTEALEAADAALYASKAGGRNRVTLSPRRPGEVAAPCPPSAPFAAEL